MKNDNRNGTVTPMTPEEMERDTAQTIRRVCVRMIQEIDRDPTGRGLDVHFDFMKSQMERLAMLRKTARKWFQK